MSVLDQTNELELTVLARVGVSTDTTAFTTSFDVANFDGGFMGLAFINNIVAGDITITLQDSPDDSVWTDIPEDKLIDPAGNGNIFLDDVQVGGTPLKRIGAFSTDRFIRFKSVTANGTSSMIIFYLIATRPENLPAGEL